LISGTGFDLLSASYTSAHNRPGIVLGYGNAATADIEEGCADCENVSRRR